MSRAKTTLKLLFILSTAIVFASSRVQDDSVQEKLDQVQQLSISGSKDDSLKAATLLRSITPESLDPKQKTSWVRFSRLNAIRLGDLDWLKQHASSDQPEGSDSVIQAYRLLTFADLTGAEKTLDGVKFDELNQRDIRRAYALKARLAQLKKDTKTERQSIEEMIRHLPSWPTQTCQPCHEIASSPGVVTRMPFQNLWFGNRYAELLKESGEALKIKSASEASLKKNPKDDLAKIQLGYALIALGKTKESNAVFDSIPYSESEKHDIPYPKVFFVFP